MGITPVTLSPSYSDALAPEGSGSSAPQPQAVQPPAAAAQDTVRLSQLAQIQQMAQRGETASAIASTTGLPVSQIDSDLDLSTSSSSVVVAAPSGHGGGHAAAPAASSAPAAATPGSTLSVRA